MDFITQLFCSLSTSDSLKVLLFLLVSFLLGLILGWLLWGAKYKAAKAELEARTNELNALKGQYASLKEQFDLKDTDLRKANLEIDDLYARIRRLEGEKGQMHADLYEANEQIAKLTAAATAAPVAAALTTPAAPKLVLPKGWKMNDLKLVEGIGPKIEELLHAADIKTWAGLAASTADQLKEILDAAGERFRIHDPGTWPTQAGLLANGEWDKFKEYTEFLKGGKDPGE